jgi:REP element-mobilizing transposase RayT
MVNYRRNFVPGGMYFFTVTLANRKSKILVDHVDLMRNAIRVARQERPSVIDAIVILPDHLHAIFMLPPDDSDFSGRWRRIKGHFSSALIDASAELKRRRTVVWRFGSGGSGSTPSAAKEIFAARRLHSFQSGQACAGAARARLAPLFVSSLCKGRNFARGLGGRRR